MHIIINGWFLNQSNTGSGQYVRQLVTRLPHIAPQHTITVVIPDGRSFQAIELTSDNLTVISDFLTPKSNFRKLIFEQSIIPKAADALRADLLHVPYWAPPLRARVPIVVTIHDLIPLLLKEYRGGARVRLYTALVAAASREATLILTDSNASKRDIIQHLDVPESRVQTIYLAADSQFSARPNALDRAAARRKYDLPDKYVLYFGGFDPRKNIETLLQVYTWGQSAIGYETPLVIAGKLPEQQNGFFQDPREIAKRFEIEDVVHIIGEVDEEDKVALFQGATAFLYPSRYEGFGLPVLEALSCGVPVVGSDAASIPEVVGNAGTLVDADDARKMAGALIAIVTEPQLRDALSERALEQAAKFSWDKTAQETLEAYESAVSDKQ